jgi:hypothetical protein
MGKFFFCYVIFTKGLAKNHLRPQRLCFFGRQKEEISFVLVL